MRRLGTFAVLAFAPALFAAPPSVDVPAEIKAGGDYVTVVPKTDAKAITYIGVSGVEPFPSAFLKDPKAFVLPVRGLAAGRYTFAGVASLNDEHTAFKFVVVVGDAPPVPPTPPVPPVPPNPPIPPTPEPLKAFRVVIIYESAFTLTAAQRSVVYGAEVAKYLSDNCTDGEKGWRRRDKDAPGGSDPAVAALWAAVQPKVTVTPCFAVQRNDKVDIIPVEATPAKMIEVLKAYKEGK